MTVSLWRLSAGKKSTSSFLFSLKYCKDIVTLLFESFENALLWTLKVIYQVVANCCVYQQTKNQLYPPRFPGDIARYTNLFRLLRTSLVTHTKNDCRRIKLCKTSIYFCMSKIKFMIHFRFTFWRIMQFDWLIAFWLMTRDLELLSDMWLVVKY